MWTAVPCYAAHWMFKLSSSVVFFWTGIFSSAWNRLCYIQRSSLCVIRFKSWSLIVDSTLSPASVPQEPLGWVALLHFPVFFSPRPVFSCDLRAVCKAVQSRMDSIRWNDRLIVFNELFWHRFVLLSLFADQTYLTLPHLQPPTGSMFISSVHLRLCGKPMCVRVYLCLLCAFVRVLCDQRGRRAGGLTQLMESDVQCRAPEAFSSLAVIQTFRESDGVRRPRLF